MFQLRCAAVSLSIRAFPVATPGAFPPTRCFFPGRLSEERFIQAPRRAWRSCRVVRRFRENTHGRKPINTVPPRQPPIGERTRQRPRRFFPGKPAIVLKIVFVQFAPLPVHDDPHSLQRSCDDSLPGHCISLLLKVLNSYYALIWVLFKIIGTQAGAPEGKSITNRFQRFRQFSNRIPVS